MSLAALAKQLAEAGTPLEGIILALEAVEARDRAAAEKRARVAERKRRQRERERDSHATVTGLSVDNPPSLDKEIPPRPPKEINPNPRATCAGALARKAAGFGPPNGVDLHTWNAFCSQRKKALTRIAYDRMLNTLAQCADAGWPPGEIVERSIEKTWETLYVPTERRNGSRPANDYRREQPESPWVLGLRQAEARDAAR